MSDSPPIDPLSAAWIEIRDAHLAILDGAERLLQASRAYAAIYAARTHTQAGIQFDVSDLPLVAESDASAAATPSAIPPATEEEVRAILDDSEWRQKKEEEIERLTKPYRTPPLSGCDLLKPIGKGR